MHFLHSSEKYKLVSGKKVQNTREISVRKAN
nr:MAG TPA: hypothetical protein [Caudoviricetes sp.]